MVAAWNRWQALTKTPIQMRTLPDPELQLQEFTVGSPRPGAGYETSDFYYTGFGASQEIPGPGKLRLQGEIAEKDADVARHQYEAAQRDAAENVRESYFELYYLKQTIRLLEDRRSDLGEIAKAAEARYRVGQEQLQDVLKAQLLATELLNQIEHHHREMEQRETDLKAALGRPLDSPDISVGGVEPTHIELTDSQLARIVAAHSTTLMMDRAAEGRGEKALELARRGFIPDFAVGYMYQKTGPGLRDYYALTLSAKVPLYFWRKQSLAVEQADLALSAARSQTRAHQLDTAASAENQLAAIHASERILAIYKDGLLPQAESSLQAAEAAYQASKVDFQTLISAFVELRNLNEEYYRELADHEIAVAKLEQIIGDSE